MWFLWFVLCVVLASSGTRAASFCTRSDQCALGGSPAAQARYDYTRIYNVELATAKHVQVFQALEEASDSCSFMGHARVAGQKLTIMVAAPKVADFDDLLQSYNVSHRILNYNFQELIDANYREVAPESTPADQFDWKRYFHLDNIYDWLEKLAREEPQVVTMLDMGLSTQGLPIKGVKIAFASEKNQTTVFIESGIHAREWIAPATATYFIEQLLHSTDPSVQSLARAHNWLIFPTVNPDGYRYSFTGDRMWRKNRNLFGICRGVDLNRNFPLSWNTTGASGNPCKYDFSGPSAASEVETQRIIQFLETHAQPERIRTYLSLHSYSQLIMFPYGHTAERVENYADLKAIGQLAAERIKSLTGRIYKSGSIFETIYPSSGGSKDWAHSQLKVPITFTFELRGPPESEELFILSAKEIEPTAREAFAAVQTIVEEAGKRGYYQ
ncbi:zinc carboxypeptidase [Drosophila grimshawi]|uniref:Zinc carboxypeptidase A 1 n=1 Tax=Drosophila grimshawi TaxID=7222 RepID=B4JRJ3_DROGR|nr:zinc carboxypeptidase [Drosophila grimshawi]EDV94383.1 GH19989 [Drosophila grimshawi]